MVFLSHAGGEQGSALPGLAIGGIPAGSATSRYGIYAGPAIRQCLDQGESRSRRAGVRTQGAGYHANLSLSPAGCDRWEGSSQPDGRQTLDRAGAPVPLGRRRADQTMNKLLIAFANLWSFEGWDQEQAPFVVLVTEVRPVALILSTRSWLPFVGVSRQRVMVTGVAPSPVAS